MLYASYAALIGLAFLYTLNAFLRGAKREAVACFLTIVQIALVTFCFFLGGLGAGLLSIGIIGISFVVVMPIAARIASKLLSGEDYVGYIGPPSRPLRRISTQLANGSQEAERAIFDYCERQHSTQTLLRQFRVTRSGLEKIYRDLIKVGAGQWRGGHYVAASALVLPESLQYLLERRGEDLRETAFNLLMYFEQGTPLST